MLTLQIDTIRDEEKRLEGTVPVDELPALYELVGNGQLTVNGPIGYHFRIFRVSGMIEIVGHVDAHVTLDCSRCLESFEYAVASDFELTFADELPEVEDETGEEVELTAEDMGINLLEGEEIDLKEPLIEQLLLELPFRPLCRVECKGLCPHCGVDLNKSTCNCSAPTFDTRFAALKNLKIDSDKK